MNIVLRNIIRFICFILLQAFVLDKVHPLHQFVKPVLYFLFILWLPFNISRGWLLVVAFLFGLCMDYFSGQPGMHAAACVLIAYLRPFLLGILVPQETTELSYNEPGFKSLGTTPYIVYILVLTFLHHAYYVFLEWLQFGNFIFFIGKVGATTGISILLILAAELLFPRKNRYRTNVSS